MIVHYNDNRQYQRDGFVMCHTHIVYRCDHTAIVLMFYRAAVVCLLLVYLSVSLVRVFNWKTKKAKIGINFSKSKIK